MAITPAGVHELVTQRARGLRRDGRRRRLLDPRRGLRRGRRHDPRHRRRRLGHRRPDPQGQGADRRRSTTGCARARPSSPTCTWPPTSRCTEELVERKVTGIAYETVELPDRSLPLLAPMSEVAGRLAPQVGAAHADARPGRPRHPHGRRLRRLRRQGRRHRRRRLRHERRRDRARHAGRGAAARPQRRPAAPGRRDLPGPLPDRRVQRLRGRAGRSSTPTWSSARCWCPAPRPRRWSPTSWSRG